MDTTTLGDRILQDLKEMQDAGVPREVYEALAVLERLSTPKRVLVMRYFERCLAFYTGMATPHHQISFLPTYCGAGYGEPPRYAEVSSNLHPGGLAYDIKAQGDFKAFLVKAGYTLLWEPPTTTTAYDIKVAERDVELWNRVLAKPTQPKIYAYYAGEQITEETSKKTLLEMIEHLGCSIRKTEAQHASDLESLK